MFGMIDSFSKTTSKYTRLISTEDKLVISFKILAENDIQRQTSIHDIYIRCSIKHCQQETLGCIASFTNHQLTEYIYMS